MNRIAARLCAVLALGGLTGILSPADLHAQSNVRVWSDADLLFVSSDLYIPRRMIRNAVYDDPAIRREIARVGIPAACPAVEARLAALTLGREEELRRALVGRIRASFPAQMLQGWVAEGRFSIVFGGRIEDALNGHEPFATLPGRGLADAKAVLASLPATSTPWRGRFADWDFERLGGLPYGVACSFEGKPDADARKRVFDGFYKVVKD